MLKIGTLLDGKYRILSIVGHGGMSTVYLARNERANKNWAVKELRKTGREQDVFVRQILLAEVEIMKYLDNPHLPSIVDVIDVEDTFVIVMDFIEGISLEKLLKTGAIPEKTAIEYGIQLCEVLQYLHGLDPPVIYRDMKPSNVILRPDGVIMLLDFGTAKEYRYEDAGGKTTCLGTRGYAAPEQYGGQGRTDERTDLYCLGATLHHLVTGQHPGKPPYLKPVRQICPELSEGMEKIISKCTMQDPEERYSTAEELRFDLEHVETLGKTAERIQKRKWIAFAGTVLLTLAGLIGAMGCRIAEEKEVRSSYEYYVSQGDGISEKKQADQLEQKLNYYQKAVSVAPERPESYLHLLEWILEDRRIEEEEVQAMQRLLGQMQDGVPAKRRFQKKNRKAFDEFSFSIGVNYYFYCQNSAKQLSLEWLSYAAESRFLGERKRVMAESMQVIARSYGQLSRKIHVDYDYGDYWQDLESLIRVELPEETGNYLALGIYRYAASELKSYALQFWKEGEISGSQMKKMLDRIQKGTDGVETMQKLDLEDQKLIQEIRIQTAGAEDVLEMLIEKGG